MTLSTEPQTFDASSETKQASDRSAATELRRGPEAGLLSREATASVDTAFNTLAQTVKKHEPTLEMWFAKLTPTEVMVGRNLPSVVERMVQAEIERVARGR